MAEVVDMPAVVQTVFLIVVVSEWLWQCRKCDDDKINNETIKTKGYFAFYVMTRFLDMVLPGKRQDLGFSIGEVLHWPKCKD